MQTNSLIIWIVIGLVAGWLASFVVGGGGMIRYLVSGLLGSFVGGLLFQWLGVNLPIAHPIVRDIVVSTVGAIVLILAARVIA
jgi:uncharacterized membrane protein YeaQ/YmgE (transglycosylase-associated protein family)